MPNTEIYQGQDSFERELQDGADQLVALLSSGDVAAAMQQIQHLNELRHKTLYNEVGRLTRAVHNTIVAFTEDVSSSELMEGSRDHIASISDASDRLSYVIELTERNAHKTIDEVDETLILVAELEEGFNNRRLMLTEFEALQEGRPELADVYKKACRYAEDHSQVLVSIKDRLTGILVAQEYQDITGQLIKRVIQLVSDIERQLIDLTAVASRVNSLNGMALTKDSVEPAAVDNTKAEGPQMAGKGAANIATNQDEVDDLLSSLGF